MASYTGGRIKRIKLRNFMTYDEVDITPVNGLNLIVGLNGSGKSSIMCAICLGLAGNPQSTGRASSLSDFIKHGEQQAEIEIELESTQDRNVVITRKINGNESEWYLNKRPSDLTEVTGFVKTFNIDTSNLCQFLPQEKVVEFSRMDKKQRLENMLQAIGEPQLFDLFNDLKSMSKKCGEIENNLKQSEQEKHSAEEKNDQISDEVQKQESRVRLKKELEDMFKIKSVIRYGEIRAEYIELKKERESAKNELILLIEERDKALTGESNILSEYQEHAEKLQRAKSRVQDLISELSGKSSMVSNLNEQVDNVNIEFKNRIAEKRSQNERLQDITIQIEGLEILLEEELKKSQNMEEQMLSSGQALSQLQVEITQLYQNMENASIEKDIVSHETEKCKNDLMNLKDEQSEKLSNLKKHDEYTYEAVLWLNDNSEKFKSRIYLPILEINVHSKEYYKYIENHISTRDMFTFVCEDKEDCRRFTDILKNQKNLPVNIVMAPDEPLSYFKSPALSQEFKNWGFECFLINLFTAPEPVMRYLCCYYFINVIPVSISAIDNSKVEDILQTFKVFYADNIKITCKQSRYGDQNLSLRKDFIINQDLLVNHDDSALQELKHKIQILEEQLHEKNITCKKLKTEFAEKEKIQEKCRQERKCFEDSQKQIQNISTKLSVKKNYCQQMSVVINEEAEKAKVTKKVQLVNAEKQKLFSDIITTFKDIYSLFKEIIKHTLCMNSLSKEYRMTKAVNEGIHDRVKQTEKKFTELTSIASKEKDRAQELHREIEAMKINPTLCSILIT